MFVDATYTAFLVPMGIAFHFKAQYFSWYNAVDIAAGKHSQPCSLYPQTHSTLACELPLHLEMDARVDTGQSLIAAAVPSPNTERLCCL